MTSQAVRKTGGKRTLGAVLMKAKARLEDERGKRLSFAEIRDELVAEYRIGVTPQTVRDYHRVEDGRKRNPLLVAALVEFYGLKIDDLPADEAERIFLARDLLGRVVPRTPPGTRTRNLQTTGLRATTAA